MAEYESIPQERQQAYLANAEAAMNEAAEPVVAEEAAIKKQADLTILEAVGITVESEDPAGDLVEDITNYKDQNDMNTEWSASLDRPIETGIVAGAEKHLRDHTLSFEASAHNTPTAQSEQDRAETIAEIDGILAHGEVAGIDELFGLTIDKDTSEHRLNSQGVSEYQAASGQWISETAVDRGHARWYGNPAAQQKASWFVDRKTIPRKSDS